MSNANMSDIKNAIINSVREKVASYTPDSLSDLINRAENSEQMSQAIADKIKEYKKSGRLVDKGWFWENAIGPHTAPKGSSALALFAKAINSIRPDTIDYKLTPSVNMSGMTGEEIIEDYTNNSAKYMDKISPGIAKKTWDAVAAHEILESEAMDKNIDGITNLQGGVMGGGLLGGLAGLAGLYALAKKGKNLSADSQASLVQLAMMAPLVGVGAGGAVASGYNWLRGVPGMEDGWSSHMSADIPRLESVMLNKLGDPALTEIFKAMRTGTGERRAIQEAAMQDYGENLSPETLAKLQAIDPMQYFV